MKKLTLAILLCLISLGLFAEDHPLSTIQGDQIDLKTNDHAFAGSIKHFVVWGFLDESTFTSELIMRKDGKTIKSTFKKWGEEGPIGGEIAHTPINTTEEVKTMITFARFEQQTKEVILKINDEEIAVKITSDDFNEGHFINPTYTTTFKGQPISFTIQGEACFGMSLHYIMMIVGAMVH